MDWKNKRQRTPKGEYKIDNPEKIGNIEYTRHRPKHNKNKLLYASKHK